MAASRHEIRTFVLATWEVASKRARLTDRKVTDQNVIEKWDEVYQDVAALVATYLQRFAPPGQRMEALAMAMRASGISPTREEWTGAMTQATASQDGAGGRLGKLLLDMPDDFLESLGEYVAGT